MKQIFIFALALLCICPPVEAKKKKQPTMVEQYAKMYEERPQAIVIMPPINKTQHVEAKDYFYSTMYIPLCDKGYYVFPPMLTMEMFQAESAYDAELFIEGNLSTFRDVLGADAAMFSIIKDWKRVNALGVITVEVEYILRSTKTGETLYQREGRVTLNLNSQNTSGGLVGFLVSKVADAIATATTDKYYIGSQCSTIVLSNLPAGQYSTKFDKDQNEIAGDSVIVTTL